MSPSAFPPVLKGHSGCEICIRLVPEMAEVACGRLLRTRPGFADAVRVLADPDAQFPDLQETEMAVFRVIAFHRPIDRAWHLRVEEPARPAGNGRSGSSVLAVKETLRKVRGAQVAA